MEPIYVKNVQFRVAKVENFCYWDMWNFTSKTTSENLKFS